MDEKDAIELYKSRTVEHFNFKVTQCGFFINQLAPHLGASPDVLVEWDNSWIRGRNRHS